MRILVYGSLVPDIVFVVPRLPIAGEDVPAGKVTVVAAGGGGNVAVALADWDFDVVVGGNSVGDDPLGRWVAEAFAGRDIELPAGFVSKAGVTAANGIIVTPDGERTVIGSDYQRVTWLPVSSWEGITAVMVDGYSGEAGAIVIGEASDRGLPVVGSDRTGPSTTRLSMLLWSGHEHPDPAEAAATAANGPIVVVTNGPGPVVVFLPDGSTFEVIPKPSDARDSTGAGDVFAAAVTSGLADGLPTAATLERAVDVTGRYVAGGTRSEAPPLTTLGT